MNSHEMTDEQIAMRARRERRRLARLVWDNLPMIVACGAVLVALCVVFAGSV